MLLRAILLLAMSSAAWGAGVTLDLNLDMSIEEIRYDPLLSSQDAVINYIDSSWEEVENISQDLDSFQSLDLSHANGRIGIMLESTSNELYGIYSNGQLNAITINPDGSQLLSTYPFTGSSLSDYGLRNGAPYVLDTLNDTILEWNVNHWDDIKVSQNLPDGHYYSAVPYSNGYLITTADRQLDDEETEVDESKEEPAVPTMLWDAGDATQEVPIIGQVSDSKYINTPDGALQIYSENLSTYTGHWLGNSEADFTINVNAVDYPLIHSATTSAGTFIAFYNSEGISIMFWLAAGSPSGQGIEVPQGMKAFYGCFSANNKAFCMLNVESLGFALYEMENGEFILDTQLNEAISGKNINGIYSIGNNRYISAFYKGVSGSHSYLYLASGEEVTTVFEATISSSQGEYFLLPSSQEGMFYWIGANTGSTKIYKAEASGDFTFKRNLDSIVPIESPAEESSGGGSGSMPTYLLAMLLMLLFPRVRWRQVSGV